MLEAGDRDEVLRGARPLNSTEAKRPNRFWVMLAVLITSDRSRSMVASSRTTRPSGSRACKGQAQVPRIALPAGTDGEHRGACARVQFGDNIIQLRRQVLHAEFSGEVAVQQH